MQRPIAKGGAHPVDAKVSANDAEIQRNVALEILEMIFTKAEA